MRNDNKIVISVIFWDASFRENLHAIDYYAEQKFLHGSFEIIWVDYYNSTLKVEQRINKYKNASSA